MKNLIVFSGFLLIGFMAKAQVFGGHPASQKWRQVNTDTARIIFPTGLDSQARRVAAIVHAMAANQVLQGGNQLQKIDIVLQHNTMQANGYAGLGPFRSEFFITPSAPAFELGSLPWTDKLAVHEYRHIQQYNNFRHGASKLLYYLFGEQGLALGINAAVPGWYYEGDAVYAETKLSQQGRGRLPLFTHAFPALWQGGKDYSWMKLRNGSLKDYVPSHYHLGYLLVAYGREKYGDDFWQKVTRDASAFKGLVYPFQRAVKTHAGTRYNQFVKDALAYYKDPGNTGYDTVNTSSQAVLPINRKVVTNYFYPHVLGKDSLIYLKTGYRQRPAFVMLANGKEQVLRYRDISLDEHYSYRNGKLIYAAYAPQARWGWQNYSELRVLDIATGVQQTITEQSRYFWPDISADGQHIVATHLAADGHHQLHLLSATGELVSAFDEPGIGLISDAEFLDNERVVAACRYDDGSMNLVIINFRDMTEEELTLRSMHVVGNPAYNNGKIYFTAGYNEVDELFSVNPQTKEISRLNSGFPGSYFPQVGNQSLYFSRFTAEGYQLQQLVLDTTQLLPVDRLAMVSHESPLPVTVSSPLNSFLQSVPSKEFETSRYPKSTGLLNFHSWRPYYEDPLFSFSIYGQNVLNTLQTELYYQYNQNDREHSVGFNTIYGGLFPLISAGSQFTFNRLMEDSTSQRQFHYLDSRIGLNLPLNFTGGRSYKYFNAGSSFALRNEFNTGVWKGSPANDFSYLTHFINWTHQVQQARQHIFPRIGYNLTAQHRHAITSIEGYQFYSNGQLYLPGFLRNHHLVLNAGFQQRDTIRQLFGNRLAFSRGYHVFNYSRMWRTSANYHLPLLLPDWGFGNIFFLERLRTNLFYDFSRVYSRDKLTTADSRSTGMELFFDTKWWNEYPLTFGIRYSRLLDNDLLVPGKNPNQWEFILPISLIPR